MDCKQTKPKQNKTNKKIQHRHTIDNKVNKTKIPPAHMRVHTHSGI